VHLVGFTIKMWFLKLGHILFNKLFINYAITWCYRASATDNIMGGGNHLRFPLAFLLQHIYSVAIVMPSFNVAAFDQC
jgi:hypothetical protein